MRRRWRVFLVWALVLSALWVFANLPRNGGSLLRFLEWAGFPWRFAFWKFGQLEWFDPAVLAADVALGIVVVLSLSSLWVWSRREGPP